MSRRPTGQVVESRTKRKGTAYALRFWATNPVTGEYGRQYELVGYSADGCTRRQADEALQNTLADVRRRWWRPTSDLPAVVVGRTDDPTFHAFASDWLDRKRDTVKERTIEACEWALNSHLLPLLGRYPLSQITFDVVERYTTVKVRERKEREVELNEWEISKAGPRPPRGLSNRSINSTLKVLGQILDAAIKRGHIDSNPSRGFRLKAAKPHRTWLKLEEVSVVLDAAGKWRALLATMILAGLRIGELCALRWRAIDLAGGTLRVEESKTDAGEGRVIGVSPMLLDELKAWKQANLDHSAPDDLVFPTRKGTKQNRSNVSRRVLAPAIKRANAKLAEQGKVPIVEGVTNHTMRRTFMSLLYEAGADPAYVMDQAGHESAAMALEVYAKVMARKRDTGERMDALIRGADWATETEAAPVPRVDADLSSV